jgi:type I restriction enzyme R subunit
MDPKRIENNVGYILEHFNQKTKRNTCYEIGNKKVDGFNSIFCVSSIEAAKKYYQEFKKQQESKKEKLKVVTIFSYAPNENISDTIDEEEQETTKLDKTSRDFLDSAIKDYNEYFETNFSTDGDGFQNYYKDVSKRMVDKTIDLLIVVNMFLTGFDAKTLNTL